MKNGYDEQRHGKNLNAQTQALAKQGFAT